jgi:rhodanese-related sulfurtransferase
MKITDLSSILAIALTAASLAFAIGSTSIAAAEVPDAKRTTLGLYMTATEAAKIVEDDAAQVLFIDVRTPGEVMFVGAPTSTDSNVPFVDLKSPTEWDEKNNRFLLIPNATFAADVEASLKAKKLTKDSKVIVMCRSGDRSGKAVDALAKAGFTNAWTVLDGFEGDMSKEGRRDVNGWRIVGLPWTYKLDKSKLPAVAGGQ